MFTWEMLGHALMVIISLTIAVAALYLIVMIPLWIICFLVGCVWSVSRFFIPILPSFWDSSSSSGSSRGSRWPEKTEADKHRDLVEHIRIQQMNADRNRR